jgi:hypothetical protein
MPHTKRIQLKTLAILYITFEAFSMGYPPFKKIIEEEGL